MEMFTDLMALKDDVSEVQCLTPRGRYDIKIYQTFLQLHGKTFDYKIPYTTVLRLFLLPHKDGRQVFFVMRSEEPVGGVDDIWGSPSQPQEDFVSASLPEVAAWVVNSAKSVPKTSVFNGFKIAEKFTYKEDTLMVESDSESEDDEPLINLDARITPELAELFHSDTEG
ncbi:SSRP1 [Mytilus coruscus]|uniref:FACT complex subunit SSRP1 n=1 Tax=Mytilus coruscus TaxID=42192 RepID=A0A6J8CHY6_MYTCO|nr:SSRP1 [Mytilus coruscus]